MPLTHDLVICTRNRAADVATSLQAVARQTRMPERVLVVDSSDGDATAVVVEAALGGPLAGRLEHVAALPGLTRQRNLAISMSRADVVHFLDDDAIPEPDYVDRVMAVFETDSVGSVGGVGGLITNLDVPRWTRLKSLFGLTSRRGGAMLRSGRNTVVRFATAPVVVDWLSGCAMSYRRSVFDMDRFDESFVGYGLGEDADLSYRVRQHLLLVVEPRARAEHRQSPVNRLDAAQYTFDELVSRRRRVRSGVGRLSPTAYWYSVVAQTTGLAVATAIRRPGAGSRLRAVMRAIATIRRSRRSPSS